MVCAKTSSIVLQDVLKISFILVLAVMIGCGGGAVTPPVNNGPFAGRNCSWLSGSSTIVQGQSTTLSWKVTNAASFSISPAVASDPLPMIGSATVSPSQTTTYVGTATDANGKTATNSVTVTVVPQGSAPTMSLSVSPNVVAAGQSTTLTWASTNATSVVITPSVLGDDVTSVALSGSTAIVPSATTTYTATATGAGGVTASASATINILGVTLVATPATIGPGQTAIFELDKQQRHHSEHRSGNWRGKRSQREPERLTGGDHDLHDHCHQWNGHGYGHGNSQCASGRDSESESREYRTGRPVNFDVGLDGRCIRQH